jgi:hypothetical protein
MKDELGQGKSFQLVILQQPCRFHSHQTRDFASGRIFALLPDKKSATYLTLIQGIASETQTNLSNVRGVTSGTGLDLSNPLKSA